MAQGLVNDMFLSRHDSRQRYTIGVWLTRVLGGVGCTENFIRDYYRLADSVGVNGGVYAASTAVNWIIHVGMVRSAARHSRMTKLV